MEKVPPHYPGFNISSIFCFKTLKRFHVLSIILIMLAFICGGANSAQLKPRNIAEKPFGIVMDERHDRNNISVKFIDDLDIGIDANGYPVDRLGSALKSQQALRLLEAINLEGGIWFRATGADEETIDEMRATAENNLGRKIADLNNYFILTISEQEKTEFWINRLNTLTDVEIARPIYLPPPPPLPDNYQNLQGYLNPAATGIDAEWAWSLAGGTGDNVAICDIEFNWNSNHHDLPLFQWWVPEGYTWSAWGYGPSHGTAVLGEMVSLNNGWGTTGASYGASAAVAPCYLNNVWIPYVAIEYATTQLSEGDIILIELQTWGPGEGFTNIEWDQPNYDAIIAAIGNGIHVVEASGNGFEDLDDPIYNQGHAPFLPENHSGAIIVGAGAAPSEFGGSDTERSRLEFSNYGSRVDLQGWGERVMTTGYGWYYESEGPDYYYIDEFGGTSGAAPIVASAIAIYESVMEVQTGSVIDPAAMRTILVDTGSPQQAGEFPITQKIGPMPNIRAALEGTNVINSSNLPSSYVLCQNYPNPFNCETTISFDLPEASFVSIEIFDLLGKKVTSLINSKQSAGRYTVNWNAAGFSSGIYFYKLQAGDYTEMMKMSLIK
ncbi:MAG: T9SS type A sorting domain-containing protein [candidate division Zixibacteria bacterium]|nr:T9SS type A sorting domain-containing protein [candidate division Zixibacteria bacterium]